MTKKLSVVISEGRNTPSTRQSLERELAAGVANWPGVDVAVVPHLYDLAPDGPGMEYLRSISGDMIVLAKLYPRATFWILDANRVQGRMGRTSPSPEEEPDATAADRGDDVPDRTIWCLDLRAYREAKPLLEAIRRIVAESTGEPVAAIDGGERADADAATRLEETARYRWYPVIDYGRCKNCLECLNFCLFGVFGLDFSERILVEQPDACRNGCPACSRVCPNLAIMFPQHDSPAIAGDPAASPTGFEFNLVQLLGSTSPEDLAAAERDRALSEKSAEPSPTGQPPEKDALDALVDDLDKMDL